MVSKIIHACEHEETIARQRSPITKEMHIAMATLAENYLPDLEKFVILEFFNVIRVALLELLNMPKPPRQKSMSLNMQLEISLLRLYTH
jgi:hypothetical protein